MSRLSIIVPTLNESAQLPHLLEALKAQTRLPDEIIVADAGSSDGTAELARAYGARVVPGGMPGPGRNAGARQAEGDILLFFDADVLPAPDFIELVLDEFERSDYVVATCLNEALSNDIADKILIDAANLYLQVIMPISPRAPGCCIIVRRNVHQAIGGFDETLKMSEDHDYVRRASQLGEFGLLTSVRIPVSMRRLEKEGIVGLALKYFWCEMYALAGKPIRSMPFEYEFGAYQPAKSSKIRRLIDISELRTRLGQFENPIYHLSSDGLENLRHLIEFDPLEFATRHIHILLERQDIEILRQYLQRRLELILVHKSLADRLAELNNASAEMIHIIDIKWLHPGLEDDSADNDDP